MEIKEVRLWWLVIAIEAAGSVRDLAYASALSEKYLRQVLTKFKGQKDKTHRGLGNNAARKIEAALDWPSGKMDNQPTDIERQSWKEFEYKRQEERSFHYQNGQETSSAFLLEEPTAPYGKDANPTLELGPVEFIDVGFVNLDSVVENQFLLSLSIDKLKCQHLKLKSNTKILCAFDSSMCPTINQGDLLLVDISVSRSITDGVYLIALHGELQIRRIQKTVSAGIRLTSDNRLFDSIDLIESDVNTLKILGKINQCLSFKAL
jgi:hypothetical protein